MNSTGHTLTIDRNKLKREKNFSARDSREVQHFQYVDGIHTYGKKDATSTISKNNDKWYRDVKLEEHYVIIGELDEFYLSHTTPNSGKGMDIAAFIHEEIKDTPLEDNLRIIGSDGTPIMTGEYNGAIKNLKNFLAGLCSGVSVCCTALNCL